MRLKIHLALLALTIGATACESTTSNTGDDLGAVTPDSVIKPSNYGDFSLRVVPICAADTDFVSNAEFTFRDARHKLWSAPIGTRTNGLSVPQLCMSLVGSPVRNESLGAALVHDAYCGRTNKGHPTYQDTTWQEVHRMFYEACLAGGTPSRRAKAMYTAVYLCGPRWPDSEKLSPLQLKKRLVEAQLFVLWINKYNPSIETLRGKLRRIENKLMLTEKSTTSQ
jgi:hypothetical protein